MGGGSGEKCQESWEEADGQRQSSLGKDLSDVTDVESIGHEYKEKQRAEQTTRAGHRDG